MDITNMQELYKYWIGSIQGIRTNKVESIIEYFGSPEEAYCASNQEVENMIKSGVKKGIRFTDRDLGMILASRDIDIIKQNYENLKEHSIEFVTMLDQSYPEKLRNIYDPPFMLYYKGKLLPKDRKIISVVGARECSIYGKETAKYLAGVLAKENIIIISGLARGIDSYAHMGALSQEGCTYGILGCGIDICYPMENINLYMDMQMNGGIISEYGPGVKPLAYHFPMRNRIISALSDGILVIEAKEKSGSLITVDMGLDQGKNIYAVPGRIGDKLSAGCNNLIKMGAKVVTSPQDILEDLLEYIPGLKMESSQSGQLELIGLLHAEEQAIYDIVSLSPKHIEELLDRSEFDIGNLTQHLLSLELKGLIHQPMKNYYSKAQIN